MMNSISKLDREDEKRMLPCRFFRNGFCHRGGRCRFYHPAICAVKNAIKVPALPSNFGSGISLSMSSQSQQQLNGIQQMYSHMNLGSPVAQRMRSSSTSSSRVTSGFERGSGHSGLGMANNGNGIPLMPNHQARQYSNHDYDQDYFSLCSPCDSSSSDLSVLSLGEQNTCFKHINWREFLAPGQLPPPPIKVPEQMPYCPGSSDNKAIMDLNGDRNGTCRPMGQETLNEDTPPEGSKMPSLDQDGERKLTPREELQMKVKKIAKELAEEPRKPLAMMDSYFLNFDFNSAGYSSIPATVTKTMLAQTKSNKLESDKVEESPRNIITQQLMDAMNAEQKDGEEVEEETAKSS